MFTHINKRTLSSCKREATLLCVCLSVCVYLEFVQERGDITVCVSVCLCVYTLSSCKREATLFASLSPPPVEKDK